MDSFLVFLIVCCSILAALAVLSLKEHRVIRRLRMENSKLRKENLRMEMESLKRRRTK